MAIKHGGINNRRKRKKTKMKRRRHHQPSIAYRRQQSAAGSIAASISASAARSSGENNISIVAHHRASIGVARLAAAKNQRFRRSSEKHQSIAAGAGCGWGSISAAGYRKAAGIGIRQA
jgi:hypothetical protein